MRIPFPSLHRPFRLAWNWRSRVLGGLLLLPLHAAATLAFPMLVGRMLRGATAAGDAPGRESLSALCGVLLALAAVEAGTRWGSRMLLIGVSRRVERQLKDDLIQRLVHLPSRWHRQARSGDLLARLTQDVELLRFLVGPILLHGGSALLVIPVGLALMLQLSGGITALCAVALGVLIFGLIRLLPKLRAAGEQVQESLGVLTQHVQEANAGIRTVQAFASADRQAAALDRVGRRYLVHNLEMTRLRAGASAVIHGATRGIVLVVIAGGALAVGSQGLSASELFTFVLYLGLMLWPIQALGWSLGVLPRALAAGRRVEEVFAAEPEPQGTSNRCAEEPDPEGPLEVRGLSFRWPEASEDAIHDLSFTLPRGASLGIVGTVGSGKSTLLELLLRLEEPPPGTVFLDGMDVTGIPPARLRPLFAYAQQEPFLFGDTIAANVTFGTDREEPEASLAGAIEAAALDQDLPRFPDGLQTLLGERGITLSGGQRQRVSLARALHADRPILLLDDVVSALDPHTEVRVTEAIRSLEGRRLIVASHRISAVMHCDLILVLDHGQLVQAGTHQELCGTPGPYRESWHRQRAALALEGGFGGPGSTGSAAPGGGA